MAGGAARSSGGGNRHGVRVACLFDDLAAMQLGSGATHVALCNDIRSYIIHWCKVLAAKRNLDAKMQRCKDAKSVTGKMYCYALLSEGEKVAVRAERVTDTREGLAKILQFSTPLFHIRNTRYTLVNDCDLSLGEVNSTAHENSSNNKNLAAKHVAFTLAEVLITLGIISVVAALTIPSLIAKYQDKVLINQTKKAFSQFQNALALASQDNGIPGDNSLTFPKNGSTNTTVQNLSKYFNGAQVCMSASRKGCSQFFYQCARGVPSYNNNGEAVYDNAFAVVPKIVLADGSIFGISPNSSGCENTRYTGVVTNTAGEIVYNDDGTPKTYDYYSAICANVVMDVNGVKGPNQYGRDVYHFWVYKNNIDINSGTGLGGTSLSNILSGKEKLVYTKYQKGQKK